MKRLFFLVLACACVLPVSAGRRWVPIIASAPPGTAMTTPVFVASGAPQGGTLSTASTTYTQFTTDQPYFSSSAPTPIPIAGTVSKLYVTLVTAPGSGKSWDFTLYQNGSATALTVHIADTNLTGSDLTHSVTVAAGDLLSWQIVPTGTPTAFTDLNMACVFASSTAGESFVTGGMNGLNPSVSAANYLALWAHGTNATTEANISNLIATPGTIDHLYVNVPFRPGTGTSNTYTIYQNGSPTAITCTISGTGTSASDLTHSITVAAGDTLSLQNSPTSTPGNTNPEFGFRFVPTTAGESIASGTANAVGTGGTRWFRLDGVRNGNAINPITTVIKSIAPIAFTLKKLYTAVNVAPGGTATWTSLSYVNAGDGNLTATITSAATTANDTTHSDSIVQGDAVYWKSQPANTPAAITWYKWAATVYIAP